MKKSENKASKMLEHLRVAINSGKFTSGGRLPSIQVLMAQFELSYGSVKRGLDKLERMGLIEKRAGKGTFVKTNNLRPIRGISKLRLSVFHSCQDIEGVGIYPTVLIGVQDAAAEKRISLLLHYIPVDEFDSELFNELNIDSDGTLLLGEYDRFTTNLSTTNPTVGVSVHNMYKGSVSIVDIDPISCAEQASDHFESKGVQFVEIITPDAPAYHFRGEVFANHWMKRGGETATRHYPKPIHFQREKGYFFTTGATMNFYSREYKKNSGTTLSKSRTIIGIDGKNLIDPNFHDAPCVALDWKQAGHVAVRECLERIEHPGAGATRIYIPGKSRFP